MHNLGTLFLLIGAIEAWIFVAVYATRPWHEYPEGRHLMMFTVVLAGIMSWLAARTYDQDTAILITGENQRVFIWFLLMLLMGRHVILLLMSGDRWQRWFKKGSEDNE